MFTGPTGRASGFDGVPVLSLIHISWLARRPVSKMISLPPPVAVTRVGLKISWFMWTSYEGDSGKNGQQRPAAGLGPRVLPGLPGPPFLLDVVVR